ncbi:MAG: hypothetical protein LBG72_05560 [Spirochaetaceae bacterium]|nr:hypothetical protein [Spirochaetaceae bacterium]
MILKRTKRRINPVDFAAAVFVFCFSLIPHNNASAQYDPEGVDYFSVSAGFKINGFIRGGNSIGFGGAVLTDYRFFKHFSAGARVSALATSEVLAGQVELLARYYIHPVQLFDVYISVNAGIDAVFRGEDPRMSRGSLVAAGEAGVRISLPAGFFVEPFVRGGYPFLFAGGISIGYRFESSEGNVSKPVNKAPAAATVVRASGAPGFDIVHTEWALFAPDSEIYNDNISRIHIEKNDNSVAEIVRLLNKNPFLFVRLEGFVYPIPEPYASETGDKEMYRIKNLIYNRALAVAALLRDYGINSNRILMDTNPLERRQPSLEKAVNNHVEMMLLSPYTSSIER